MTISIKRLLAALHRRPKYRLASPFLLVLLTAACGGGNSGGGGPSDTVRPGVQIQNAPASHDGRTAFTLGIRFSESVSGFARGDMAVTGAAVTAFSGSGASYTVTLTPNTPPGNIVLDVPANVAQDAAGNGNTAAMRQTVVYVAPDTDPPRVTIDAPVSHDGRPFEVTFAFSEPVRDFEADDVRITGGRLTTFPSQALSARYTATLTPDTPPGNIVIEMPANVAQDAAGNGNTAAARQQIDYVAPTTSGPARISGRLSFDRVPFTRTGALDYGNIRQEPIRGVWVDAVSAGGAVLERTRSDANGRYRLDVAANTEVRIRISAHMQRTEAGGPRWDVKVTDNTNGNALYVMQSDLASSGTGASTRNLNAPSGWVASGSGGRYANSRVAGPFAILSFIYDALQTFAEVDPEVNLPALEYRWSPDNRSASGNLASGAIGASFYNSAERLIYLLGKENEDTDEYDRSVVLHEFAHHFQGVMSRDDSMGGQWDDRSRLDMRLAFSEGFGDTLDAMITNDPLYRNTYGPDQSRAGVRNMETNPVNPDGDADRTGWYHSRSVAAILYDLYDGTDVADKDPLNLGFAPIYNTLTSDGFRRNRYYTSIYTLANQLLTQVPNRTATESRLDALLRRQNIFGRGDNGAGETNRGGLPETARVLPVYKSMTSGDAAITLCSVVDTGTDNRLGNRAFVEVRFAASGSHTLTMRGASGSTGTLPRFRLRPYRNAAIRTERQLIDEPRSQTVTGNFRAGEPTVLEAYDERNVDDDASNDGDSCFSFSAVNNP